MHRYLPVLSGDGQANLSIPSLAGGHSEIRNQIDDVLVETAF